MIPFYPHRDRILPSMAALLRSELPRTAFLWLWLESTLILSPGDIEPKYTHFERITFCTRALLG